MKYVISVIASIFGLGLIAVGIEKAIQTFKERQREKCAFEDN